MCGPRRATGGPRRKGAPHHRRVMLYVRLSISRARPITLLVVCGLTLIVALAAATALVVASMRAHILADSEREQSNTARILAEQAQRTFGAVDAVEGSLIARMQQMGIASRADLRRMAGADVHAMLRD